MASRQPERILDLFPARALENAKTLEDYIILEANTAERARYFDYAVNDASPPDQVATNISVSAAAREAVKRLEPRLLELMNKHRAQGIDIQEPADYLKACWAAMSPYEEVGFDPEIYVSGFLEVAPYYDNIDDAFVTYMLDGGRSLSHTMYHQEPDVKNAATERVTQGYGMKPLSQVYTNERRSDGKMLSETSMTHHSSELEGYWLNYLSDESREAVDRPEWKEPYLAARSKGDKKAIQAMIVERNPYAMHDVLFREFASLDRLREMEKNWEMDEVARQSGHYALDALFHSNMAKMAAYLVPELMERYDRAGSGNTPESAFDHIGQSLSRILGDAATTTYEAFHSLRENLFIQAAHNEADYEQIPAAERTPEKIEEVRKKVLLNDPMGSNFDRHPQRSIIQKETQAIRQERDLAVKEVRSLKGQLQQQQQLHKKELVAATRSAMEQAAKDYTQIAYAACADHVREKAALHGEVPAYLDDFPTLEEALAQVQESRRMRLPEDYVEHMDINQFARYEQFANAKKLSSEERNNIQATVNAAHKVSKLYPRVAQIADEKAFAAINDIKRQVIPEAFSTPDSLPNQKSRDPEKKANRQDIGFEGPGQ